MVLSFLFGNGVGHNEEAIRPLLPTHRIDNAPPISAKDVTIIALRLKVLIEATIPCDLKESLVTKPHSPILTEEVIDLAKEAASEENKGCMIYCLLVCLRWFKQQAKLELYDADMNLLRATACEVIAKRIIENEPDEEFMMQTLLLRRYSILRNGEETVRISALERAIDLHALIVISSSGFQKTISYLWKGWIIQDPNDGTQFISYKHIANRDYWTHFDHDRLRAPIYQNAFQIFMSVLYLILYTIAINTINPGGDLDVIEGVLYLFTASYIFDEVSKFWKVGKLYFGFWNAFNLVLYSLLTVSFVVRMMALAWDKGSAEQYRYKVLSYNFLAIAAPMFWIRMLLYLDSIQFFGTMLLVLKVMMKESLIFFALLAVVILGFLQAFIGMDNSDNRADATTFILQAMVGAILQSPELSGFDDFAHPFGLILYYLFTFIVMVILLNILIALYNQAYTDITENSTDEYMALFSHKTIQFVRAPDENVFIPPLNLIEIFCLIIPLEWWMSRSRYAYINDMVMKVVYSPFMLLIAFHESRAAKVVIRNRTHGESDDDTREEWEEFLGEDNGVSAEWKGLIAKTAPDVEKDRCTSEVLKLKTELEEKLVELKEMIEALKKNE